MNLCHSGNYDLWLTRHDVDLILLLPIVTFWPLSQQWTTKSKLEVISCTMWNAKSSYSLSSMGSHKEVAANVSFRCDVLQPLELLDQGKQEGKGTQRTNLWSGRFRNAVKCRKLLISIKQIQNPACSCNLFITIVKQEKVGYCLLDSHI